MRYLTTYWLGAEGHARPERDQRLGVIARAGERGSRAGSAKDQSNSR